MPTSPLTNNNEVSLVYKLDSSVLIDAWQTQFKIDITPELLGCEEICLYQCDKTKLLFFEPSTVAGSGHLYEQLQKFDWFYMPHKWEHDIALQDLKDCHEVLEVGCAFGAFIELGLNAGLNIKGIELNKAAVAVAQDKKLPVEFLDIENFSNSNPASLDAICSFQVLEHISNPKEFIQCSIQSLKIGGRLIICVPNAESFLKYQNNLLDMPPHHMLRWSEASFRALESLFPLKLERVVQEPLASYHVSGFLNSYKNFLSSKFYLSAFLLNRYTLSFYEKILQLGLRKHLKGQSLYVQFRRTA